MSEEFVIEGQTELADSLKKIERIRQLSSLIEVVAFLRDNPDLPIPYGLSTSYQNIYVPSDMSKAEYVSLVRKHGFKTKLPGGGRFAMTRQFGVVTLQLTISRDKVCTKIITGNTWMPDYTKPGYMQENVEWKCDPLLEGE